MSSYADLMQMCRLCLVKEQVNLPIFDGPGELQQIFLKITACLPVKVSREDNLPKSICDGCGYKLDLLYQFWNTSSNSEKQLIDWLTAAGVDPKHTANEPIGLASQPTNVILKEEPIGELDAISTDAQSYIIQQQQLAYKPEEFEESQQNAKSTKTKAVSDAGEEPAPKRPRRATRNSKSVREDSDDDYVDTTATDIAKTEDDTEEDDEEDDGDGDEMVDDDMGDPDFVAAEEDTEQPGPSGVSGTKPTSGPSEEEANVDEASYASLKARYGLKECVVFVGEPADFDHRVLRFMRTQSVCEVDASNIVSSTRLKYKCDSCTAKFRDYYSLSQHVQREHADDDDRSSVSSQSSAELYEPDIVDDDSQSGGEASDPEDRLRKLKIEKKPPPSKARGKRAKVGGRAARPLPAVEEDEVIMWEQPSAIKKCLRCMQIFKDKRHYGEHLKTVHNVFACMMCPQAFYSESNFEAHIRKVHHKEGSDKWRCSLCSLSFADFWHLSEHNFAQHRPMCNLCPREFPDVKSLVHHKTYRHLVNANVICKDCGLTLPDTQSLTDHCLQHGYLYFACELCAERFSTKVGYLDHMFKSHSGAKPSARVLHLDKRLNIKATKTILPQPANEDIKPSIPSPIPSIQPVAAAPIVSTAVTTIPLTVPATSTSNKVPIPRLGSSGGGTRPSILFGDPNTTTTLVQVQNATTGQKEHKLLVMEKDSSKAYLVPTMMVNQNGQVKYAVPDNAVPEPVTINNPGPPALAPIIQSVPQVTQQPTIANIQPAIAPQPVGSIAQQSIQPIARQPIASMPPGMAQQQMAGIPITQPITLIHSSLGNQLGAAVVPPVVSSGVHPTGNQPTFVMSTLPNSSTQTQGPNNVTFRFANSLSNMASPRPSANIAPQPTNMQTTNNMVLNKLFPLPVNPIMQPKMITISGAGATSSSTILTNKSGKVSIPRVGTGKPLPSSKQYPGKKPPTITTTRPIKIAAKKDDDVREMPKLEIQSVVGGTSEVEKVINARLDASEPQKEQEEPAPVLNAETTEGGRPKIFLKPLSQLLEKPNDPTPPPPQPPPSSSSSSLPTSLESVVVDLDADIEPSTSNSLISKLFSSIDKASEEMAASKAQSNVAPKVDALYKCNHCSFRFKKLSKLQQHQRRVKCRMCTGYTGCYRAMDEHYKAAHALNFQCMTCDIAFDGVKALRDHNKTTHYCNKCKKFYLELPKHQALHVCFKCNDFACTAKSLTQHYLTVHNSPNVCAHCRIEFAERRALHKHKMDVHFCTNCNSLKADMAQHNCNLSE